MKSCCKGYMALYDEPGEPSRPEPFSRFTLERIQKAVDLLPLEPGADNFLITCHIVVRAQGDLLEGLT